MGEKFKILPYDDPVEDIPQDTSILKHICEELGLPPHVLKVSVESADGIGNVVND